MSGTLTYWVQDGKRNLKAVQLTVFSHDDLGVNGVADLRRRRLGRIVQEAIWQGARLSYRDLGMIMLTSKATLKRDMSHLRRLGGLAEQNLGSIEG